MIPCSSSKFKVYSSRVLAINVTRTPQHYIETVRFYDENPQLGVLFYSIDNIWNEGSKSSLSTDMVHALAKN